MQNPTHIIVMEPRCFGGNEETALNNYFQKSVGTSDQLRNQAELEHRVFVERLSNAQLELTVLHDDKKLGNADAIFLNNWFCILPDKTLILFPMWAVSRRKEVRDDIVKRLQSEFSILRILDYQDCANLGEFCEGTGSIIFDFEKKIAFAAISARTSVKLFERICRDIGYVPISFEANDARGNEIYHTNVLLAIGENTVVVCSEAIVNPIERSMVMQYLNHSDKVIVDISFGQLDCFCGNVFEVTSKNKEAVLCMSETAYTGFTIEQRATLMARTSLIHVDIPSIERAGGGSVRCMMAAGY